MKRALTTVLVISLATFLLSCSEPLTTREKGAGIGTLTEPAWAPSLAALQDMPEPEPA